MNHQLKSELLSCINSYPKDAISITCNNISNFDLNTNLQDIKINSNIQYIKLIPSNSEYNYQLFNNNSELELDSIVDKRLDSYSPSAEITNNEVANHTNVVAYEEIQTEPTTYTTSHRDISGLIEISVLIGIFIAILGITLKFTSSKIVIFTNKKDVLINSMTFLFLLLSLISYQFIDSSNSSSGLINKPYAVFILITISFILSLICSFYLSYTSNKNLFYVFISLITKIVVGAIALILTLRFILIIIDLLMNRSRNFDHHIIRKESFYASGIVLGGVYWFISKLTEENEDNEEEYDEDDEEYYDEDEYDEYEEVDNKKYLK